MYDHDSKCRCAADDCCSELDTKGVAGVDDTYPTPAHATNVFEYLDRIVFARRHSPDEVVEKCCAAQVVANYVRIYQQSERVNERVLYHSLPTRLIERSRTREHT